MPSYLVHLTNVGQPIGVIAEDGRDYYDQEYKLTMRPRGQKVYERRSRSMPWGDFINQQASNPPGSGGRWETFVHTSRNLTEVLERLQRTVVKEGYPEPEEAE